MPTPNDAAHSASILEHYSGFDPANVSPTSHTMRPNQFSHLRRESEFSVRSSNSSHHQAPTNSGHGLADSNLGTHSPRNAPSVKSSSSSLRQTVAMLKGGVFPPGIQQRRSRLDSDSDASHYDDDDDDHEIDVVENSGLFGSKRTSMSASMQFHGEQDNTEIFSNAADSPSVPTRVSSVSSPGPSTKSRSPEMLPHSPNDVGSSKSRQKSLVDSGVDSSPGGRKQSYFPSSPIAAHSMQAKMERHVSLSPKATEPSSRKDASPHLESSAGSPSREEELEKQLALAAENDDPNRPKTLKEARALAKERAKQRMQAKGGSEATTVGPLQLSPTRPVPAERPSRAPQRESFQSDTSAQAYSPKTRGSPDVQSRGRNEEARDWQGHTRQRATPVTPGQEEEKERRLQRDASATDSDLQRGMTQSTSSTMAMEDLQTAVGEAIQDVSFVSTASQSTATDQRAKSAEDFQTPSIAKLELPTAGGGEGEHESSYHSSTSFDSARESPGPSSIVSSAAQSAIIPSWAAPDVQTALTNAQTPHVTESAATALASMTNPGLQPTVKPAYARTPTAETVSTQRFVPHTLHAQQRSTAPNKIARLDVYGKTVPWPPAFNPAAIIDQRRLAPWERARSYAHYCNDLTSTASGLMVWIEMVQRPAQRIVPEPATPVKKHLRGEGTDHSGYAASVRSDATFPMRGDGGKAKELMSSMPATISESPPSTLPTNIPYPILVQQPVRGSSSSQEEVNATASSMMANDRSTGSSRSGNFFSSLGRKGSTRRTPGSGSMTGLSSLSSTANNAAMRSAMRAKGKSISNPVAMNASPSLLSVKSTSDSLAAQAQSSPSSSPTVQASANRAAASSSSPLHQNPPAARMPMGPRAPTGGSAPFLSTTPARRESATSLEREKGNPYGLPTLTGGSKASPASASTPTAALSDSPTDYASGTAKTPLSPPLGSVKSSFSYASVRDKSHRGNNTTLHPPPVVPTRNSSDSNSSRGRRGSQQSLQASAAENEALDKLADVLPDAERSTLLEYLRRANGNDLIAIGDYLQAQSKSEGKQLLR